VKASIAWWLVYSNLASHAQGSKSLQPSLKPTQPLWDLSLALLKQYFDELCVNESETYGFDFP
jgi:hypothetical protein